jgi:glycosyltransferase involved in cell wall biosynthesis
MAEALRRFVDDAELRAQLERAGPRRAAGFSWTATAEATRAALLAAARAR